MAHFSDIDYTPLCRYLENLIGVSVSIDNTFSNPKIICTDLTPYIGIMGHCLRSASIDFFNFKFTANPEPGDSMIWATVNLFYQTKEGGSNGIKLCQAYYFEDEGWIFSKPA